jgi:hypothetical protein
MESIIYRTIQEKGLLTFDIKKLNIKISTRVKTPAELNIDFVNIVKKLKDYNFTF